MGFVSSKRAKNKTNNIKDVTDDVVPTIEEEKLMVTQRTNKVQFF